MWGKFRVVMAITFVGMLGMAMLVSACAPAATPTPKAGCPDNIVICWTPPDITGVFRTATDFFMLSALMPERPGSTSLSSLKRLPAT